MQKASKAGARMKMRKTAVFLSLLLILSIASISRAQSNLVVSGITNPSEANGRYVYNGTLYDHDSWKHESLNYYIYYHYYTGGGAAYYWNIDVDTDDADSLFYSESNPPEDSPINVAAWTQLSGSGSPYIVEEGVAEINVRGNGNSIVSGDSTPNFNDHTKFASVDVSSGTATRTYTIENMGSETLTVGDVTISGTNASDFSVTTAPSSPVAGLGSTTFVVTFNPSALGNRLATVSIVNSDSDENPYTFAIQGYGFTPRDLVISGITNPSAANGTYIHQGTIFDFEYWKHESLEYYLFNDDYSSARYWNMDVDTDDTDSDYIFYIASDAGSPVGLTGWENNDAAEVASTGDPSIAEANPVPDINVQGRGVTITDDDVTPSFTDDTKFGPVAVSSGTRTRTFTIQNTGGATLTLSGSSPYVTFGGDAASDFSVTAAPSSTIAGYGSTTFDVTFDPSVEGTRTATISIASDDEDENPYNFAIQGDGFIPKDLTVSGITTPAAANGNYLYQGILYEFPYWLHESGGYYVYNDEFTNGTRYWNIDTDQEDDAVNFYSNNNGEDASPVNVTSWHVEDGNDGTPVIVNSGPEMAVEGNSVEILSGDDSPSTSDHTDFGSCNVDSATISRIYTIKNTGSQELVLDGTPKVAISGSHAADFTVTSQPSSPVAATTGTTTFTVRFDPSDFGVRSATLSISNDDSDENPYTFDIQGTGIALPVISNLDGDSLSYNEGDGAVVIDQGAAADVTDADSGDFNGGNLTATISAGEDPAEDVLSLDTGGAVTLSGTAAGSGVSVDGTIVGTLGHSIAAGSDLVVNFNANATPARVAVLIRAITYEDTDAAAPTAGARTIDVTVNDGDGGVSTAAGVTVTVSGVNDAPTLAVTALNPTFTEGGAAVALYTGAVVGTVEPGQTLNALILTVTNVSDGANEILSIDGSDVALTDGTSITTATNGFSASVSVTGGTATVSLSGANVSTSAMQTLVDGIGYRNTGDAPGIGNRVVTLTSLADNGGTAGGGSDTATLSLASTVAVIAVNDPPVVSNVNGDSVDTVAAGTAAGIDQNGDAAVADVDSADFNGGTLVIAQTGGTGNGSFSVDGAGVTCGGDGTIAGGETVAVGGTAVGTVDAADDGQGGNDLRIDFNANATPARVQTLIRNLTYAAPGGLGARTFSLTVDDGDGGSSTSNASVFTVNVTPNPPVIANLNGDTVNTRPNAAVKVDAGENAVVSDPDNSNFDGGHLLVTATGIAGGLNVDGTNVTSGGDGTIAGGETVAVGGTAVGTVDGTDDGQGGSDLRIDFNTNATPARVQTLIRNLTYLSANLGTAAFDLTVTDAGTLAATSTAASFSVNVIAPEMNILGNGVSISDGDLDPDASDDTDFGSAGLGGSGVTHTFTIENTGSDTLTLTDPSPYVAISGTHAGDFTVSSIPSGSIASGGGSTTFAVTFSPGAAGPREATVSVANDDSDENPYNYGIQGTGMPDVTISGFVTDGANPIEGATITFSHNGHTETTASNGTYSYKVHYGTTTTVRPSHPGYGGWSPADRTLNDVSADQPGQDFTSTSDADGIPAGEESGPSGTDPLYDGNGDGIPDGNQPNVASFHTADGNNYVTLEAPEGTILSDVQALPAPAQGTFPFTVAFPYGLFRFTVNGVTPGGAAQVRLFLSGSTAMDSYWKYGKEPGYETEHAYDFTGTVGGTGAEINGNIVVLHFIDGQRGDDDLIGGNGVIVDDGGPGTSAYVIPALSSGGKIVLVILLFLLACRIIRRRKLTAS
jgi:hypothetical protein